MSELEDCIIELLPHYPGRVSTKDKVILSGEHWNLIYNYITSKICIEECYGVGSVSCGNMLLVLSLVERYCSMFDRCMLLYLNWDSYRYFTECTRYLKVKKSCFLSTDDWQMDLFQLYPNLTSLDTSGLCCDKMLRDFQAQRLRSLKGGSNIRYSTHLNFLGRGDFELTDCALIAEMNSLRSLTLVQRCEENILDIDDFFAPLGLLTELDISSFKLCADSMTKILGLHKLKKLKFFYDNNWNISTYEFVKYESLGIRIDNFENFHYCVLELKNITFLQVNKINCDALERIKKLTNLTQLNLCLTEDNRNSEINIFSNLKKLEKLKVSHYYSRMNFNSLVGLPLKELYIKDSYINYLTLTGLQSLKIKNSNVQYLPSMTYLKAFEDLNILGLHVVYLYSEGLENIIINKRITKLDFKNNCEVPEWIKSMNQELYDRNLKLLSKYYDVHNHEGRIRAFRKIEPRRKHHYQN